MTNSLDDKLKRLQEARKKADEFSQQKQRVTGELDGHKKRLAEVEKKCVDEYGCEVKELPNLIKQLEEEADKSISEAERILNPPAKTIADIVAEVDAEAEKENKPDVVPQPVQRPTIQPKNVVPASVAPKSPVPQRAPFPKRPVSAPEDEDVL